VVSSSQSNDLLAHGGTHLSFQCVQRHSHGDDTMLSKRVIVIFAFLGLIKAYTVQLLQCHSSTYVFAFLNMVMGVKYDSSVMFY
jgi:hypothetical protein